MRLWPRLVVYPPIMPAFAAVSKSGPDAPGQTPRSIGGYEALCVLKIGRKLVNKLTIKP